MEVKKITSFENVGQIGPFKSRLMIIIALDNYKIACGGSEGSIAVCSFLSASFDWKILYEKEDAHEDQITNLCSLSENLFASSSVDTTIKIWDISSQTELILKSTITAHKMPVLQIISLTNSRMISISPDQTLQLWNINKNSSDIYDKIETPFEKLQHFPSACLQLSNEETICLSVCNDEFGGDATDGALIFYNLNNPFDMKGKIDGIYVGMHFSLTQISNGNIALFKETPFPSVIIADPVQYKVIQMITDNDWFTADYPGTIRSLGKDSFIYCAGGNFCQIALVNGQYQIIFGSKEEDYEMEGCGIIIENGKYFIIPNSDEELNVYQCGY